MLNYRYLSTSTEIETYSSHFVESLTTIINKRLLLEDSSDSSMEEPTINTFSEKVLIAIVIAVPCLLIFLFCVICCVYPGLSDQCYNGRERSDREYGDAVVRRHAEEEEKNKENPQERRNRIVNHVASNRVTMVRRFVCLRLQRASRISLGPSTPPTLLYLCFNILTSLLCCLFSAVCRL